MAKPSLVLLLLWDWSVAELTFQQLRGIDVITTHPSISPVFGYIALKHFLPNRRFFGKYGRSERGFFCGDKRSKIGALLRAREDCPLDANSEWIQRLFPSQDGINFVSNQIDSDVISRLGPATIGKVLFQVVRFGEWDDSAAVGRLESDLTNILFHDLNLKGFNNQISESILQEFSVMRKKFVKAGNEIEGSVWVLVESLVDAFMGSKRFATTDELLNRLVISLWDAPSERINQVIETISNRVNSGFSELTPEEVQFLKSVEDRLLRPVVLSQFGKIQYHDEDLRGKQPGRRNDFSAITKLFLAAIQERRAMDPQVSGVTYPPYFAEQALIAFMVQKLSNKSDLIEYFLEVLPESADRSWEGFSENVWNRPDFAPESAIPDIIQWDIEQIVFHVSMVRAGSKLFPPSIAYGLVTDELFKYSDCGETAIRNFFNVMLYDYKRGIFDSEVFTQMRQTSEKLRGLISFDPHLIDYYNTHNDPVSMLSQDARDMWARDIVSRRPGVDYGKHGIAEIKGLGRPENTLNLLSQVILTDAGRAAYNLLQSTEERVKFFCEIFNQRPDRQLKCVVEDIPIEIAEDEGIRVVFTIQEVSPDGIVGETGSIEWEFYNGHSAIVGSDILGGDSASRASEWRGKLSKALIEDVKVQQRMWLLPVLVPDSWWELKSYVWNSLVNVGGLDKDFMFNLFYALPTEMLSSRLKRFKELVSAGKDVAIPFKAFIERSRARIPEATNFHAAKTIQSALNSGDYPFGDPKHAFGKPDAIYTRVDNVYLERRFGIDFPDSLGRIWKHRLFGYDAMIGSKMRVGDQVNAIQACINMNREEDRSRLRSQFIARENALRELRNRFPNFIKSFKCPESSDDEIAKIYAEFPVEGFYLGGVEEWMCIFADLGSTDFETGDNFIQQFWVGSSYGWTSSSLIDSRPYWTHSGSIGTEPDEHPSFAQCFYRAPHD